MAAPPTFVQKYETTGSQIHGNVFDTTKYKRAQMLQSVAYDKGEMQMEPQNNSCNQRGDPASGVSNVQNNLNFFTLPWKTLDKRQRRIGRQSEVMAAVVRLLGSHALKTQMHVMLALLQQLLFMFWEGGEAF